MTQERMHRQIDLANDLLSVVSTMKAYAAVNIHQYERAAQAVSEYSRTIELGFRILLKGERIPVETVRARGRAGAVVFGRDQGMCGQFNEEIVSYTRSHLGESGRRQGAPWRLLAVGTRAEQALSDAGLTVDETYAAPTSVSDITNLAQVLLPRIERWRAESAVTRIVTFHNRRVGASSFKSGQLQILPIDPGRLRSWREQPWNSVSLPLFVTERGEMVSLLIRHYLFVALFRACAESLASENASRIAAMQAAESNIEERLDELRRTYNVMRQTAITEELLDVITGFEAVSRERAAARRGL